MHIIIICTLYTGTNALSSISGALSEVVAMRGCLLPLLLRTTFLSRKQVQALAKEIDTY